MTIFYRDKPVSVDKLSITPPAEIIRALLGQPKTTLIIERNQVNPFLDKTTIHQISPDGRLVIMHRELYGNDININSECWEYGIRWKERL